ncbi:MAG: hypothetical protein JO356_09695, partial [Acidobacteria bacterium]|nr:hypothetical protein [Acidobacteriota bacterium]
MYKLVLTILALPTLAAFSQNLGNEQFQLAFSSSGVSSLKRSHDLFDTDYILAGRTLGDVLLHYRAAGEAEWQELTSGTGASEKSQQEITYQIGRAIPTVATSSRANSSVGPWMISALNDQLEPKNSRDKDIPLFVWGEHRGTEEWV